MAEVLGKARQQSQARITDHVAIPKLAATTNLIGPPQPGASDNLAALTGYNVSGVE
jgi:hypothetical protein